MHLFSALERLVASLAGSLTGRVRGPPTMPGRVAKRQPPARTRFRPSPPSPGKLEARPASEALPMERLMLLDGFGLVYRGYYALPPLTTSRGELVNGVFGFCSIVLRGFQDLKPDYVAVAFDLSGPTFRHEQFADYKATRTRMPDDLRDQFPKVREVVKALRIPSYEQPGFEADDVIGTLTLDAEKAGVETTIVSV